MDANTTTGQTLSEQLKGMATQITAAGFGEADALLRRAFAGYGTIFAGQFPGFFQVSFDDVHTITVTVMLRLNSSEPIATESATFCSEHAIQRATSFIISVLEMSAEKVTQ